MGLELGLGLGFLALTLIEPIGHQRGQRQQCSPQREGTARDRLHEATQQRAQGLQGTEDQLVHLTVVGLGLGLGLGG